MPGEVISRCERDGLRFARVRFGGVTREVCVEYAPTARVGDFVLVHVGFAIATVDRAEAERTLALFHELDPGADAGTPPRRR